MSALPEQQAGEKSVLLDEDRECSSAVKGIVLRIAPDDCCIPDPWPNEDENRFDCAISAY
jgi:hypothetical protein